MFEAGDYIVYGNNGVCRVEKVGTIELSDTPKDKMYYTLCPYYLKGRTIFTPVDNEKVIMRRILTKEEAIELIDDIKNIDLFWISDEKRREMEYKEALKKCDCREAVKIIKTIYLRKKSRIAEGKKLTTGDEKYFHMAEESLYGEMAISLGMNKDEVKEYVIERVGQLIEKKD